MADIKDVSTVIASALDEIGVAGTLDVAMDGDEIVDMVGDTAGEKVEVRVIVTSVGTDKPGPPAPDEA